MIGKAVFKFCKALSLLIKNCSVVLPLPATSEIAFTEYTGILDEFTSVKRYYTDEIMEVLTEINPVLYTIDPEISMKELR